MAGESSFLWVWSCAVTGFVLSSRKKKIMERIPEALAEFFEHRATVRKYTDEAPGSELIDSILKAAMRAPTTGNMQLYSVIETRDAEMRRKLAALHFNQPAAAGAPLMLTFCADYYRFTRWCEVSDADAGYDNFLSFTSAMLDAVILAQQFVTLAELSGLGTCYLGTCLYNAPEIAELLRLPRLTVPVVCISVGYPAESPEATERLGVEGVLYRETYPELSDSEVVDIYKAKDDFAPNARFVAENGKRNLAQVFTDVRYPRAMNESTSVKLLDFLKAQGFMK